MSKKLFITADDVCLHPSIDDAVSKIADQGLLTGVSVISNARYFDPGFVRALQSRGISIGAHIALVGHPLDDHAIPFKDWRALVRAYIYNKSSVLNYVSTIFRKQIELFNLNEIKINHIDSHQHLHVLPGVAEMFCDYAESQRIRVRNPRSTNLKNTGLSPGKIGLHYLGKRNIRLPPIPCIGVKNSGVNTLETIKKELSENKHPTIEFVVHPATDNSAMNTLYSAWHFNWEGEMELLLSADLRNALIEYDYTLATN